MPRRLDQLQQAISVDRSRGGVVERVEEELAGLASLQHARIDGHVDLLRGIVCEAEGADVPLNDARALDQGVCVGEADYDLAVAEALREVHQVDLQERRMGVNTQEEKEEEKYPYEKGSDGDGERDVHVEWGITWCA